MTDSEIIELLQMQLKTQQQNEFLQKTIESLNQNIQSQTETIETLTEKIADLGEKLNKNSRNSSKPPSNDGRKKKGKVLALIERLAQLKDSMLLFARNFEVPFTNNAAERTIRNLKSKSKVAGNFRSDDGARWYLKIRSYIDSARKHGVNAFEAVKLAFAGNPALCLGF